MADDGDDGGDNGPKTAKQLRFELSNLVKQETQHSRTIEELRTAHRTRAEADRLRADSATLEAEHRQSVAAAQRRTIEELKGHVAGAQVWAREAEAQFVETLVAIRYAAGEQLSVQAKRLREWEQTMAAAEGGRRAGDQLAGLIAAERELIAAQGRLFIEVRERTLRCTWPARCLMYPPDSSTGLLQCSPLLLQCEPRSTLLHVSAPQAACQLH